MAGTGTRDEQAARERSAVHLARATVRRFRPDEFTVDREEMLGAALHGAAVALDRFDPTRGTKFSSYALAWIRGKMQDEARSWDPLTRTERRRVREGGEVPRTILSLDTPVWGEESVVAACDVEGEALAAWEAGRWQKLIAMLPPRERAVIQARFWAGESAAETAAALGVTTGRVDQLLKQAYRRLRQWAEAYGLTPEGYVAGETTEAPRRRKKAQCEAPEPGRAAEVTG